jgi:hypothetical protein
VQNIFPNGCIARIVRDLETVRDWWKGWHQTLGNADSEPDAGLEIY